MSTTRSGKHYNKTILAIPGGFPVPIEELLIVSSQPTGLAGYMNCYRCYYYLFEEFCCNIKLSYVAS